MLYYYECHRSKTIPEPTDPNKKYYKDRYCPTDVYPELASEDILLASISAHLQKEAKNPSVVGYWVLDDQAIWDTPGYAKNILNKTHDLIAQITPGHPAICGFGGYMENDNTGGFADWIGQGFTPYGCDMVGWYIYTPSFPVGKQPDSSTFDWTMKNALAAISSDLTKYGWDMKKQPIIGIPPAWGGYRKDTSNAFYEIVPTANEVEIQTKSFCAYDATSVIEYAWEDSTVDQFPWSNTGIGDGVKKGFADCEALWK